MIEQRHRNDEDWSPDFWRSKSACQMPEYPNKKKLSDVVATLHSYPPLVGMHEIVKLRQALAKVCSGQVRPY